MSNPVEERFDRIIDEAQGAQAAYSVRFVGVEVERPEGSTIRASFPEQNEGLFPPEANNGDP